jgi:GT2 family glycosyltransferase
MTAATSLPVFGDVTVVIPTIGRDLLEGCLQSIIEGTAWPARVIVVDQGSNARVAEWVARLAARGLPIDHVTSDERGAASARNRGVERVRTRFVAATDDDCLVAPDWLACMATRIRENPDAFITGRVVGGSEDNGVAAPSLIESTDQHVHTQPLLKRDPLFSNNMGFAVDTVHKIGPMDERECVRYAEDAEWSYRALRSGVRVVYAPDVVVRHLAWRDRAYVHHTYRLYARSQGGFYGSYIRRGDPFIAARALFDLARAPWLVIRGVATANPELRAIGLAYLTELPVGLIHGFSAVRRHDAHGR